MKSTSKSDAISTPTGEVGPSTASDPELNDSLGPSIDPEGQDFRDQLQVTEALDQVGVVQGIDAELKEQQRQVEEDTLEVLEAMRALDHGGTVKWRITRVGTGDPTLDGFLDTWPTKLVTLERIRDKMGGGTFYLKGFRNGKYWVHKTVEIAGVPKVYVQDSATGGSSGVQNSASGGGFDIGAFLAQQEARDAARRREMAEERAREKREKDEREERERRNRNELLAIVMPVLGTIATGITGAFAGSRSSPMADIAALMTAMKGPDPITVLTQLKSLERGSGQDTLSKVLPMLIDMASDRASGGDTGWMDVVKELVKSAGPTVGAMIEHSVQQATAARALEHSATGPAVSGNTPSLGPASQSHPALPPPADSMIVVPESVPRRDRRTLSVNGGPPAGFADSSTMPAGGRSATTAGASSRPRSGERPSGKGADMNLMALLPHLSWLKDQLTRCLKAAQSQRDPELYAALFVEELPEGISPDLVIELLSRRDWYEQLIRIDERLNQADLVPWFTHMMQGVLNSMARESASAVTDHTAQTAVTAAASAPAPAPKSDDIRRPTELPSLTGGR